MYAFNYLKLLKFNNSFIKAEKSPCGLSAALVLSTVLHVAIIFSTTNGHARKILEGRHLNEFHVNIIYITTSQSVLSSKIEEAAIQPQASDTIKKEDTQAGKNGVVPTTEKPYYKVKELDQVPRPITSITPSYPESVPPSIHGGLVKLEIKLNEEGWVTEAVALASDPPGYFEQAAVAAFLNAEFTPGIKNGHAVRTILVLQVHFVQPESLR